MSKKIIFLNLAVVVASLFFIPLAFAEGEISAAAYSYNTVIGVGCVLGLAIAAFGGGSAMGNAIVSALSGIARNPAASGKITTTLLIGLALIESLVIYTLVVALILLFVKPFFS
jgi:F-type H+-transporting ATPase subunit c